MKFLRLFRKQSIKNKDYFKYAVGEVFLVVIGILIALSVNNANEERKLRKEEKKVLLSLHSEISNNLKSLKISLSEKKKIIDVNKEILKYTGPNSEWKSESRLDSLMYFFSVSGWIYVADNGVLNEIINSGKLSLVNNFKIKNLISSLPQQISQIIEEDRLYRDDLHQYFLPYVSKNYKLRNITKYRQLYKYNESDLGNSKYEFDNLKLINDLEFENILTIQAIWIKFSIEMCENLLIKFSQLQELIELEYNDVDYDRLNQDLEEGFWG
jgi:hypothetical protein